MDESRQLGRSNEGQPIWLIAPSDVDPAEPPLQDRKSSGLTRGIPRIPRGQGEWCLTDGRVNVYEWDRRVPRGSEYEVALPPKRNFDASTIDESWARRVIEMNYQVITAIAQDRADYFASQRQPPIRHVLDWYLDGAPWETPNRYQYESDQQFQDAKTADYIARANHKGFARFAVTLPKAELDALFDAVGTTFQTGFDEGKKMHFGDMVEAFAAELRSRNMGERADVLAQELDAALHVRRDDSTED